MIDVIKKISMKSDINFLKYRKFCYVLSVIMISLAIVSLCVRGLNLGIDFSGGVLLEIKSSEKIDLNKVRRDLADFSPELQSIGNDGDMASIRLNVQSEEKQEQAVKGIKSRLGEKFEFRNVQVVGPKVGDEIIWKGIWAIILSMIAIAIYIWFRFELAFGVGAMLSLIHDVILTFGFLSFFRVEFSLTTVAAILTIVGYSINDTVVSYDRVRENLKKYRNMKIFNVVNLSTNETLTRTILTSLTTFIAVLSIFLFGGAVLRSFSAAMLFGILIGTYSSLFIAMPTLLYFKLRDDNQRG